MVPNRPSPQRSDKALSVYFGVLGASFVVGTVIEALAARPQIALVGVPIGAMFAFISWLLWPSHPGPGWLLWVNRYQTRLFSRLGIKWLVGPSTEPSPGKRRSIEGDD